MSSSAPASPAAAIPTAWERALEEALPCPLCDYDLRGLPQGRCPECGHAFDLAELRRLAQVHPYLFEHRRRRRALSALQTMLGALRPGRFWAGIPPTLPVRRGRLLLFAALVMLMSGVGLIVEPTMVAVELWQNNVQLRKQSAANYALLRPEQRTMLDRAHGGSYLAQVRAWSPLPSELGFWPYLWRYGRLKTTGISLAAVGWPGLTLLTLVIFQQSLRRARIRQRHVLRVVVYAAVPLVLLLPATLMAEQALGRWDPTILATFGAGTMLGQMLARPSPAAAIALAFSLIWAGYSLAQGYRRYLRFPHAIATVVASQVIVWLSIVALLSAWSFMA